MNYKVYTEGTLIEFGRYKDKTLLEVAKENKSYLEWFIEEIDNVSVNDELLNHKDIQSLNNICILKNRLLADEELYGDNEAIEIDYNDNNAYDWNYDNYRHYSDEDIWSDIAGTDDPDVINDVFWNLD